MAAATIVHDTSEAVELCPAFGLYLKPITKMTISVALPQLKQPGKSISNWEVMERLKGMVHSHQFSTLRISKSTMDFIRFEGEVENKSLVKSFLACLDGKTIKLSGFSDILKVRAAEFKIDFPTRHDWDSFFRDAKDMNETLPGERPDTIHLEGLPCKWFALKESGSEKPSEDVLVKVFEKFGEIRNVDIPMLDPYREEMTGRNFHTFSFGGHLNFEAYVQYREYVGFIKAMSALRGMKLMYKGEDGKAVACNIKVRNAAFRGSPVYRASQKVWHCALLAGGDVPLGKIGKAGVFSVEFSHAQVRKQVAVSTLWLWQVLRSGKGEKAEHPVVVRRTRPCPGQQGRLAPTAPREAGFAAFSCQHCVRWAFALQLSLTAGAGGLFRLSPAGACTRPVSRTGRSL